MQESLSLPDPIRKLQKSLDPYVKQRRDAAQIRRILASHLNSTLHPQEPGSLPQPLSLVDSSCSLDSTTHGLKGAQKEYVRCARANLKARRDYAQASNEHQGKQNANKIVVEQDAEDPISDFLHLVKQQQKHDVLCISQDYINMLNKKPAAMSQHLDPQDVLKNLDSLPHVPSEVLQAPGTKSNSEGGDLSALLDRLEKSVLRAKLLLKREQKLLAKFRANNESPSAIESSKLQALATARNELINWVETELARAGDSPDSEDEHHSPSPGVELGRGFMDSQLLLISKQYARYAKLRQSLVNATTCDLDVNVGGFAEEATLSEQFEPKSIHSTSHISHPYFEELVSISNQQKATSQQKSHLAISLAKLTKEVSQALDRLTDESHLLQAHPFTDKAAQRRGRESSASFAEEISNHEKPDSFTRARGWTYASDSAATLAKMATLEKLEEGSTLIDSTRQSFLDLQHLIGSQPMDEGGREGTRHDIWAHINGTLGAI
ncbi:hypothetical protein HYALB_00006054 [Hymenoscyphus albidus]|uniref:Uncharacterized protein n=1 Tax=Hymenoscyphus albidus TaxID=595503 RepID=A0A9N9M400_9HELO|nr:hypothetical protein HYALB_00006054 [Hymenoscyphus albidus]